MARDCRAVVENGVLVFSLHLVTLTYPVQSHKKQSQSNKHNLTLGGKSGFIRTSVAIHIPYDVALRGTFACDLRG
jgi:hypothetical protein